MSDLKSRALLGIARSVASRRRAGLSRFVNGLPRLRPGLSSSLIRPKPSGRRFPYRSAKPRQTAIIDKIGRYDYPRPSAGTGELHLGRPRGPPPYDFRRRAYAVTRCHIGGYGKPARAGKHIRMRLSDVRPSTGRPWRTSESRPLMKFAREIWQPGGMRVTFSSSSRRRSPIRLGPAASERSSPASAGSPTCRPTSPRGRDAAEIEVEAFPTAPRWSPCARSRSARATPKAWRVCECWRWL